MKVRSGFVSNSSSSSFLAVGFGGGRVFEEVFAALVGMTYEDLMDSDDYWGELSKLPTSGGYGEYTSKDGEISLWMSEEPQFVGLDVVPLLAQDLKLSEMKILLQKKLKDSLGVDVSIDKMHIELGTSGY